MHFENILQGRHIFAGINRPIDHRKKLQRNYRNMLQVEYMFYMKMLATCVTDAQMSGDMVRETVSIF